MYAVLHITAACVGEVWHRLHRIWGLLHMVEKFGLITSLYPPYLLLLFLQLKCDGWVNVYFFGM
jgi:hypothetical protein